MSKGVAGILLCTAAVIAGCADAPSSQRSAQTSQSALAPQSPSAKNTPEKGSADALQTFVDGIADWEAKAPGVKAQMVIAFGLFSMPPGGINKQPNVDYHVWMDQQMNIAANHPVLSGIAGIEWWTSVLADEETVRFVGKLYRHYAIEGRTNLLTKDGQTLSLTTVRPATRKAKRRRPSRSCIACQGSIVCS